MNLNYLAKKYFRLFSKKDIDSLSKMFDDKISLRDWQIKAKGKKAVLNANKKIFKSCKSIKVKPIKIYTSQKVVIAEIEIIINNNKKKELVLDIITFNKKKKIIEIKAYLGS